MVETENESQDIGKEIRHIAGQITLLASLSSDQDSYVSFWDTDKNSYQLRYYTGIPISIEGDGKKYRADSLLVAIVSPKDTSEQQVMQLAIGKDEKGEKFQSLIYNENKNDITALEGARQLLRQLVNVLPQPQ